MKNLALFDLDHTLLPIDSDHEWGEFLVRQGVVDAADYQRRNDAFFAQYNAGNLDPVEYLEFTLGTLAGFAPATLRDLQGQYLKDVIAPLIHPSALALLQQHRDAGDLVAIVTATNAWLTAPIARLLGVEHLLAARPVLDALGHPTGKLDGLPSHGPNKIVHLHAWLAGLGQPFEGFERTYFYSDSHNDIPLLSVVSHPVATNPSAALRQHATALGWPLLHLFDAPVQ
jgi:HAD superfamily hydrolase (TIGR01490 family)